MNTREATADTRGRRQAERYIIRERIGARLSQNAWHVYTCSQCSQAKFLSEECFYQSAHCHASDRRLRPTEAYQSPPLSPVGPHHTSRCIRDTRRFARLRACSSSLRRFHFIGFCRHSSSPPAVYKSVFRVYAPARRACRVC